MNETNFTSVTPPTTLPAFYKNCYLGFLDVDSSELARQMTLMQGELYQGIPIYELHGQKWNKADKTLAPHVMKAISRFNHVLIPE
jgi:hypothetical protein